MRAPLRVVIPSATRVPEDVSEVAAWIVAPERFPLIVASCATERDPEDVLRDVKNRYVTIENAKDDYNVSITSDLEVDQNATTKLRNL